MMYLTCVDTYSLEVNDVGKYRTPIIRAAHKSLAAAEHHRRQLIRQKTGGRLFYISTLVEGERVHP